MPHACATATRTSPKAHKAGHVPTSNSGRLGQPSLLQQSIARQLDSSARALCGMLSFPTCTAQQADGLALAGRVGWPGGRPDHQVCLPAARCTRHGAVALLQQLWWRASCCQWRPGGLPACGLPLLPPDPTSNQGRPTYGVNVLALVLMLAGVLLSVDMTSLC